MLQVDWYWLLIVGFVCLAIGAVVGLLVMRAIFNKQLKDNPPINRNMIRAMFMQMGRKPSEKDITRVMEAMGQHSPENKNKKEKKAVKAEKKEAKKAK